MSIDGVKAGILFLEMENGVKISFRSKGDIPINMLAQEFGGGGHMNAAGARIFDRDLSAVEKDVLHAAKKFISLQTKVGIE
jgi:phosphoesterase RecJ-like protein